MPRARGSRSSLACALALAACAGGQLGTTDPSPPPPAPGQIVLHWTLNGAPGCEACTAVGTVWPVMKVDGREVARCSDERCVISEIAPGRHTLAVLLYACSGNPLAYQETSVDVVSADAVEATLSLDLPIAEGSATVSWIVNGGSNCVPGAIVRVDAFGTSCQLAHAASCDDQQATFVHLLPGTYDFYFLVDDPSVTPTPASFGPQLRFPDGTIEDVAVDASAVEAGPVDLFCSSCPGDKPAWPWPWS